MDALTTALGKGKDLLQDGVNAGVNLTKKGLSTGVDLVGKGLGFGAGYLTDGAKAYGNYVLDLSKITLTHADFMCRFVTERKWLMNILSRITFLQIHKLYFVCLCFFGGCILYGAQNPTTGITLLDSIFMATSACCVTGLSSADFSRFNFGAQFVMFVLVLMGSSCLCSIVPLIIRRFYVQKLIKKIREARACGKYRKSLTQYQLKEHKALGVMIKCILCYWLFFHTIAFWIIFIRLMTSSTAASKMHPEGTDIYVNRFWFSLFTTVSAFQNAGFAPLPDNLVQFAEDPWVLMPLSFCIMAGNVGLPVFLRTGITIVSWFHRPSQGENMLKFVLKNARQLYSNMFPAKQTRILFWILFGTTFIEVVLRLVLDWNCFGNISPKNHILASYFQAVTTRTAGFNVVNLSGFSPSVIVLEICLMYVSAYPVAVSIRATAAHITGQEMDLHPADDDEDLLDTKPGAPGAASPGGDPEAPKISSPAELTSIPAPVTAAAAVVAAPVVIVGLAAAPPPPPTMVMLKPDQVIPTFNTASAEGQEGATEDAEEEEEVEGAEEGAAQDDESGEEDDEDDEDAEVEDTGSATQTDVSLDASGQRKSALPALPHIPLPPGIPEPSPEEMERMKEETEGFLTRDLARMYLALQLIVIFEGRRVHNKEGWSVVSILYEIISAYGTVGLSLGLADRNESFSSAWTPLSKWVLILVMFFGRHRGMPDEVDKAIMMPAGIFE